MAKSTSSASRSEGEPDTAIEETDWTRFEFGTIPQDALDRLDGALERFFAGRAKAALAAGAVTHRVILFPVSDAFDLLNHPQLSTRGFWQPLDYPQDRHGYPGGTLNHPGGFVRTDAGYVGPRRRAPTLGEHNGEILCGKLGYSPDYLTRLRAAGVI